MQSSEEEEFLVPVAFNAHVDRFVSLSNSEGANISVAVEVQGFKHLRVA